MKRYATNGCWFAEWVEDAGPCEGRLVRCHLIDQQKMRQEFPHGVVLGWRYTDDGRPVPCWKRAAKWEAEKVQRALSCGSEAPFRLRSLEVLQQDPRGWVRGCGGITGIGGHHGRFDSAPHDSTRLVVPRRLIPEGTEEFAGELELGVWMDDIYGERSLSHEHVPSRAD